MTTEIPPTERTAQRCGPEREFSMRFTSTVRGARLARRLATQRMDAWDFPYGSVANDAVTLIVGELAANAVRHGQMAGRDFSLRLLVLGGVARVEVTDTRDDLRPPSELVLPAPDLEAGRGLWLVAHLAARWGVVPRSGAPGKTIWAEVRL